MKRKKAKIKKVRVRKVERVGTDVLIDAELLVEGAPEPPAEPIPDEPIEFDPPVPEHSGWAAFFKSFWK